MKRYEVFFAILIFTTCGRTFAHTFKLFTMLYNEKSDERIEEYIQCIDRNLQHKLIQEVIVLYDILKSDDENKLLKKLKQRPVQLSYIRGRVTYGQFFELANALYPNDHIVICNADIYFNDTLYLLEKYDFTNKFLALTRWNVKKDGSIELFKQYPGGQYHHNNSIASQDAWIYKTPFKRFANDEIPLGLMACDTLIAYHAKAAGLDVINPCFSIQCCHLHLTEIRNYTKEERILKLPPKPYGVEFSNLDGTITGTQGL